MKKQIFLSCLLVFVLNIHIVYSSITSNPIISRGKPVYTSSGTNTLLVDNLFGGTGFYVSNGSWIAINIGAGYSNVFFNWNNPSYSWSDVIASAHSCKQGGSSLVDYNFQISSNSTNGSDGTWTTLETIAGNDVTARGHVLNISGASWIKMNIATGGGYLDEIEVFDLSNNGDDIWFFPGTSISANSYKSMPPAENYADVIAAAHSGYNPAMIRGGIPCMNSGDMATDIDKYIAKAGNAKYWAIEMGTNDAWGGSNANVSTYKANMQIVIDACKAAGINPIISRMIGTNESAAGWQVHPDYLVAIDELTAQNNLIEGPDFYTWFSTHSEDLASDGVHTNSSGAASMQRLWAEAMESLYSGITIPVTGVSLSPSTLELDTYTTGQLTATVSPSNATVKSVIWSSSNTAVATVNGAGTVTGIGVGTALISITTVDGGKTASATVTVNSSPNACVNPVAASLPIVQNGVGEYCWFTTGTISNVNSWNTDLVEINSVAYTNKYSSSMPAKINGGYYIRYVASVAWAHLEISGSGGNNVAVTGVSLNTTNTTVNVGSSITLTATVSPTDATNKSVTWSSTNTAIASVNTAGVVTGVGTGSAIITVTTVDQSKTATATVTVSSSITSVTGVTVAPTTASITVGGTTSLTATVSPTNATNKSVTWSSSNTAIATVSTAGVVTGVGTGNATITVKTTDQSKTATATITVTSSSVSVTGVTVSPASATVNVGSTTTLTATVAPTNATNKSVAWSSSNTAIAAVSTTGVVTGVGTGSATITVTTADQSKTATAAITVTSTSTTTCGSSNAVSITIPFSKDGAGEYCYVTTQSMAYVNSWNTDKVTINDVDFTNKWSNSMPAAINGAWYIYYKASVTWAHFEAPSVKSAMGINSEIANEILVYPNPVNTTLYLRGIEGVKEIRILDLSGKSTFQSENNLSETEIDVSFFKKGVYIIQMSGDNILERRIITVN